MITGEGRAAARKGWPALALTDRPAGAGRARRKPAARWDVQYRALPGLPLIGPGDDLPAMIAGAAAADGLELRDGDVVVVARKVVSKAEGHIVSLAGVVAGPPAEELARQSGRDARLCQLCLEQPAGARAALGQPAVTVRLPGWPAPGREPAGPARPAWPRTGPSSCRPTPTLPHVASGPGCAS